MTKKDKKEIQRRVKMLPLMKHKTQTEHQTVPGQTLIDNGIFFLNGGSGDKVDPKKTYLQIVPRLINHKTEAEQRFKIGGMSAVDQYCEDIRTQAASVYAKMNADAKA